MKTKRFKWLAVVLPLMVLLIVTITIFLTGIFKTMLPLNTVVYDILKEENIKKSKITYLCDCNNDSFVNSYSCAEQEITDEELKKFVNDLLLSHEKMIEITDRNKVQKGDAIVVSYVVRYNSKIAANTTSEAIVVGSGNYYEEFENAVIGAVVGEPFDCELTSPIDTKKYKKGEILQYNITVESINYFVSYSSSDQYILDYYGVKTEEEFLLECKDRLKLIKKNEAKYSADNEFLDKIAQKCSFYINKKEAVAYSKKIVEQHENMAYISNLELNNYIGQVLKMTEDEFYDYCYNEGVKEIKRYLLVGAYTKNRDFDNNYAEFCSLNGYDSTNVDNISAKCDYLKNITVLEYAHIFVDDISYGIPFDSKKFYSVGVYETSNIYDVDFSSDKGYELSDEEQEKFTSALHYTSFGGSCFQRTKDVYQTALIFKDGDVPFAKVMVDEVNGYIKWQQEDGTVLCAELIDTLLKELIQIAKNGK